MAMPNVPPLGLLLTTAPTRAAHAVTGQVPRIYQYPYPGAPPLTHQSAARTTFYDGALERHLAGAEQSCTRHTEVELIGACWIPHRLKAPCPESLHEHQGECYVPAFSAKPPPQSIGQ